MILESKGLIPVPERVPFKLSKELFSLAILGLKKPGLLLANVAMPST